MQRRQSRNSLRATQRLHSLFFVWYSKVSLACDVHKGKSKENKMRICAHMLYRVNIEWTCQLFIDSRFEKEDGAHVRMKRQTTYTHYIQISFYINIAWNPPSNMSIDDAFEYYDDIHAELTVHKWKTSQKEGIRAVKLQIRDIVCYSVKYSFVYLPTICCGCQIRMRKYVG